MTNLDWRILSAIEDAPRTTDAICAILRNDEPAAIRRRLHNLERGSCVAPVDAGWSLTYYGHTRLVEQKAAILAEADALAAVQRARGFLLTGVRAILASLYRSLVRVTCVALVVAYFFPRGISMRIALGLLAFVVLVAVVALLRAAWARVSL